MSTKLCGVRWLVIKELFVRFKIFSTIPTLELGHGEDAVTVAGEGGGGGSHQTERYYPCLSWPLVASPPLQHRTGHSSLELDGGLLLGRLGEDAVNVREGGAATRPSGTVPASAGP